MKPEASVDRHRSQYEDLPFAQRVMKYIGLGIGKLIDGGFVGISAVGHEYCTVRAPEKHSLSHSRANDES